MEKLNCLSFTVSSTNCKSLLGLNAYLNKSLIYTNAHVTDETEITHYFTNDCMECELVLEMFGKRPEDTKINTTGVIISDALLSLTNISINDLQLTNFMYILAEYYHDCNGTQPPASYRFFGSMGCNGIVRIDFRTPIDLWLHEYS